VDEPPPRAAPRLRRPPRFRLSEDKTYTARVVTNCGTFEIELDSKDAPRTGGSFVSLIRENFYDNLIFHRIVTGFVIQGGDPTGRGTGGPGYRVREAPPSDVVYSEGVAAMAKAGSEPPGTSGSQFFVVTSDSTLPPEYALLGRVKKGLDVVHAIEEVPAGPDERPISPVVIRRIDLQVR
jgi:cyclophilin family peptidyl-prolyl cis-trans isomerase